MSYDTVIASAPHLFAAGASSVYFTEMCSGSEVGSYIRLIDFCFTQLQA